MNNQIAMLRQVHRYQAILIKIRKILCKAKAETLSGRQNVTRYQHLAGSSQWKKQVGPDWILSKSQHILNEAQAILDNKEREDEEKNKLNKIENSINELKEKLNFLDGLKEKMNLLVNIQTEKENELGQQRKEN